MLAYLLDLDSKLFSLINHLPHNLFLDFFFGSLTFLGFWGIIWFAIALALWLKEKIDKNGLFSILLAAVLVGISQMFLKNLIGRPRPQFSLPSVIVPFDVSQSFSFPSGHAMVAFAMAFLLVKLGQLGKSGQLGIYLLAVLISFSRIYLGKHYPGDVLAGAILGLLIGAVTLKLSSLYFPR